MKQSIGEFLATLRKAQGYTQQEVADRLSVSNRTVSAWERGAALPDILLLPALAELYGVTADEILAGERRAETALRPVLSEKSETKLLKMKMGAFFTQAFILFGVFAIGYLLFFIGWFIDANTVVWSGWRWWLLLLFLGLSAAVICAVCILALWRSAETSADSETAGYAAFCLLVRRRVALFAYIAAGLSVVFAVSGWILIEPRDIPPLTLTFAAAGIIFFLFAFLLVNSTEKRLCAQTGSQVYARNCKRYKRCALYCLIPLFIGIAAIVLFSFWTVETHDVLYEDEKETFTAYMETLDIADSAQAGAFPLSRLAMTAKEGEQYDLGDGFSCTFGSDLKSCRIMYDGMVVTESFSAFTFYRLETEDGTFSVYNLRYHEYSPGTHAQRLTLEADATSAKLILYQSRDYLPLAVSLSCAEMMIGVGICLAVCAVKKERPKVRL